MKSPSVCGFNLIFDPGQGIAYFGNRPSENAVGVLGANMVMQIGIKTMLTRQGECLHAEMRFASWPTRAWNSRTEAEVDRAPADSVEYPGLELETMKQVGNDTFK